MAEGREEFERQLRELEYAPDASQSGNRVVFEYVVPDGKFKGRTVNLGFDVPAEFPRTPPPGPHVSPALLPMNPSAQDHPTKTAPSPFGNDWQYWSRPCKGWRGREGVAEYLVFIDHLFRTV